MQPIRPARRPLSTARLRPAALVPALASVLAACAHVPDTAAGPGRPQAGLRAFASQAEMAAYHRELVEAILSKPPLGRAQVESDFPTPPPPPGQPSPEPAPQPPEPPRPRIYGSPQVRAHGDHLLVLRDGRLSTIRIAGGALEPVHAVDALGRGVDLDRMLFYGLQTSDDGVQVLAARTTDRTDSHVAEFRVGGDGRLEHLGGALMRSVAGLNGGAHVTRQLGDRVVFYGRIDVPLRDPDPSAALPSLRRLDGSFASTVNPRRVYPSVYPMSWPDNPRLHVVTVCQDGETLDCAATALYAPEPQVVHVSANAVYLWTDHRYAVEDDEDDPDRAVLYRMPLDGSAPSALQVTGSTSSPEAFLESADGYLNAHLLHDGWTEESRSQLPTPALMRVPLSAFGDGRRAPEPRHYRPLLRLGGPFYSRFVGDWLVYGNRTHDPYIVESGLIGATREESLGIGMLRWADTTAPSWLPIRVPTQAFAAVGEDAVLALVGSGDSLALAYLPLGTAVRRSAMAAPTIERWEGVLRGIVPHPDNTAEAGLLAVTAGVRPTPYEWRSTGVAFIRYDATGMRQIGELAVRGEPAGNHEVVPIFAHGRIFALLGHELAEAVEEADGVREIRRIPLR